jgi:hypothetical protein
MSTRAGTAGTASRHRVAAWQTPTSAPVVQSLVEGGRLVWAGSLPIAKIGNSLATSAVRGLTKTPGSPTIFCRYEYAQNGRVVLLAIDGGMVEEANE